MAINLPDENRELVRIILNNLDEGDKNRSIVVTREYNDGSSEDLTSDFMMFAAADIEGVKEEKPGAGIGAIMGDPKALMAAWGEMGVKIAQHLECEAPMYRKVFAKVAAVTHKAIAGKGRNVSKNLSKAMAEDISDEIDNLFNGKTDGNS